MYHVLHVVHKPTAFSQEYILTFRSQDIEFSDNCLQHSYDVLNWWVYICYLLPHFRKTNAGMFQQSFSCSNNKLNKYFRQELNLLIFIYKVHFLESLKQNILNFRVSRFNKITHFYLKIILFLMVKSIAFLLLAMVFILLHTLCPYLENLKMKN